jgi:predicted nucleic acid-binding protein
VRPVVIDASVSIKWERRDPEAEAHTGRAMVLLKQIASGDCRMFQPPHWLIEMAGVLARQPGTQPMSFIADLIDIGFVTVDDLGIVASAIELSQDLQHHLFDTLYHAVALAKADRVLVTADETYYRKAVSRGQIMRLADWPT